MTCTTIVPNRKFKHVQQKEDKLEFSISTEITEFSLKQVLYIRNIIHFEYKNQGLVPDPIPILVFSQCT